MKTLLVILSKDQQKYIPRMLERVSEFTTMPDGIWYYLDRPTGREYIEARRALEGHGEVELKVNRGTPEYLGRPQMNPGVPQFLAGHVRNVAIAEACAQGYGAILFIDGDCLPESDIVDAYAEVLDTDSPVLATGKRKESKWNYDDQRVVSKEHPVHIFGERPNVVEDEMLFVESGVIWTCNVGINLAAINALYDLNEKLYGRREVFSSIFSGTWGGEDGFLGLECLYGGITVMTIRNGKTGIVHIDHERPPNKYDHIRFVYFLDCCRGDLLFRMELYGYGHRDFVSKEEMEDAER